MDAAIRIEPTPSNARVDVDGVEVGNGVWEGRLKSGNHKIEIAAAGFIAYRRDVAVQSGRRELLTVALDRDLSHPMWSAGFVPHVYVELLGGLAVRAVARRRRQFGVRARRNAAHAKDLSAFWPGRGRYQLRGGSELELFLGYLSLSERMTRRVAALAGQPTPISSNDFRDETALRGPLGALSASYGFFERTPLTTAHAGSGSRAPRKLREHG
jgi:hypothetical protein